MSDSKKLRAGEEEDLISALPEDLRLHTLSLLPLKSAIRTGALSSRWRGLWARRWLAPSSLDLDLHLLPEDSPDQIHETLNRRGRRRLDRFSLTIHPRKYMLDKRVDGKDLCGYLDYAAACDVEDLHIEIADFIVSTFSALSFPPGCCSRLARLSLHCVGRVEFGFSRRNDAFSALEVIHLRSVRSIDLDNLLSASPRLRTLDLRFCNRVHGAITVGAHLTSLTVAECNYVSRIDADRASGLRSFRLSSAGHPTTNISATASLADLYISLRGPTGGNPLSYWIRALPDLSNLTALTICSFALQVQVLCVGSFRISCLFDQVEEFAEPNKRAAAAHVLTGKRQPSAHLYVLQDLSMSPTGEALCAEFLTANCFYLQLPTSDTAVDISLEMAEENEPDEELQSEEEEAHEEPFEEDESGEELSEDDEYETEEELLEKEIPEEYMLKERLFYEDMDEEDPVDENVPEEEQPEEGLLEYGLTNLVLAKMVKFKGHYFEMRLASFLLRKATALEKLLLVTSQRQGNHMEELRNDQMDTSCALETILSSLKRASPNAQIVVSDSDSAAIQPMHSDVCGFSFPSG
ncbi:hypothetical protein EJB05_41996, partial [Eragrostis curvula]